MFTLKKVSKFRCENFVLRNNNLSAHQSLSSDLRVHVIIVLIAQKRAAVEKSQMDFLFFGSLVLKKPFNIQGVYGSSLSSFGRWFGWFEARLEFLRLVKFSQ